MSVAPWPYFVSLDLLHNVHVIPPINKYTCILITIIISIKAANNHPHTLAFGCNLKNFKYQTKCCHGESFTHNGEFYDCRSTRSLFTLKQHNATSLSITRSQAEVIGPVFSFYHFSGIQTILTWILDALSSIAPQKRSVEPSPSSPIRAIVNVLRFCSS